MIAAFRKNNLGRRRGGGGGGGNVVDLHNLQVIEALRLLTVLLANMKRNGAHKAVPDWPPPPREYRAHLVHCTCTGTRKLTIITGKGRNSVSGPRLLPAVSRFLRARQLDVSQPNEGTLEVHVRSNP
jgi:DNA-nicking Smr family endonuclease